MADLYYIDQGYYDSGYFVYTADAASAVSAEFTQTTAVGKLVDGSASLSAEFTQVAQGYRTVEIVLSAFSDAAVSASADVTRNFAADLVAESTISIAVSGFENADAQLIATATMDITVTKIVSLAVDISAEFSQTVIADRFVNADAALESSVTMATQAERTVTFGSGLSSDAACACVNYRVRDFDSTAGALFNTAVSASATINSFAVLDSVSTLTADVERQVGASSAALTTEFTQTTAGQRVRFADSQLSSSFTQTVSANAFEGTSAALTSTATLTANLVARLRPAGYIAWPNTYGTVLDNGRLSFTQRNTSNFAIVNSDDTVQYANQLFGSNNFTVEFLLTAQTAQFQGLSSTTSNSDYYRSILNFESGKLWIALRYASATTAILQFGVRNDAGTSFTLSTAALSSLAGDSHIAFVKSGTTIYAFVNGTRVNSTTVSGVFTLDANTAITLGRSSIASVTRNNLICNIDELRLSIVARYANNATITVPTTPFANDKTAIGLFHMDNSLSPAPAFDLATAGDNGLTEFSASISAAFTQTADATRLRNISGSADLSSQFALSAIIGSIEEIAVAMFDDVELSATAVVTRDSASAQSSAFTQTVQASRTRSDSSTQSAQFTQVINGIRVRTAASTQSSSFTQVVDGDLVADITAQISSEFTQTVNGDRTRSTAIAANSEFTQSTANRRVRYFDSTQSSEFAVTAEAQRVQEASADLNTAFDQTAAADRIRSSSVGLSSSTDTSAIVNRVRYGLSDQSSEFTQVVDAVRIQQGSADISAEFTQVTDAARTRNLDSTQTSTTQVVANIVKTVDVVIATEAVATQLTAAAKIGDFLIDCSVTATVACSGSRVRFFANLSEPRGVNLQNDVSGTDLGPFLLLPTYTGGTSLTVTRSLISFWCNQGTTGAILNTDGIYDGNPSGTNILEIREESGNYFLYYYGNRAEAGIYPYVKWAINYTKEDLLHNFLLYIKPGVLNEPSDVSQYKFYLDGVEQTLIEVTNAYLDPKQKHTFTIKDALLLGYASSFYAAGAQSGYQPYKNLENTAPNSAVLAQFWMDNNTDYDITDSTLRNKFYNNGWTDLGHDGTATGLPQPDYYVRLQGYEDLNDGGTVTTNDWSWKYFNNRRTAVDRLVYDVTDFTATPDQDNPYVTQIVARLSATSIGVYLFAANLQSTSTLTATVERIQANNAAISSEFSVTANITVNIGTITDIPAEFSLNALGGYLLSGQSNQNSQFTVAVLAGSIGDNNIDMLSAFTVQADVNVIPPVRTAADLSSQFALTAVTGFEQQAQAQLNSEFALQADATEIPPIRIEANLTSAFAVTASLQGQFDNQAQLNSQFTETVTGQRFRSSNINISSQAQLQGEISKVVGFSANLPVVASTLIVGSTISIDPFYQYKVEPESRRGTVLPENRVFLVESETRLNMIL